MLGYISLICLCFFILLSMVALIGNQVDDTGKVDLKNKNIKQKFISTSMFYLNIIICFILCFNIIVYHLKEFHLKDLETFFGISSIIIFGILILSIMVCLSELEKYFSDFLIFSAIILPLLLVAFLLIDKYMLLNDEVIFSLFVILFMLTAYQITKIKKTIKTIKESIDNYDHNFALYERVD